ncbi:MAG: hypothetical protein WCF16_04820, partial [Alphaproteobacteria bacterium]
NWMPLDPPRHLHLFNSANLARLCHEAGFRDVKTFATIRGADGIFLASHALKHSGRFRMGAPVPLRLRARGYLMQLIEFALLRVRPDAGEELVVIAE